LVKTARQVGGRHGRAAGSGSFFT